MRGSLKRIAERSLAATLPLWGRPGRLRDRVLILAFHNVVSRPADAGLDRSLHLPADSFRETLDLLLKSHRFVTLDEALAGTTGPDPRPRVAVTFDDAYGGAMRLALPALAERRIPATVFVAPGRLGSAGMWWDTLSGTHGDCLDPAERNAALDQGRGVDEEVRAVGASRQWRTHLAPADAGIATLDGFRQALQVPGITIGSHSWSHPNLNRTTDAELREELERSRQWLTAEAGPAFRPWIAYPYGLAAPRVEAAAATAGYAAGFRIEGGWADAPPARPLSIPRLNVPAGVSADGMRLRGAGIFCR